MLSAPTHEQIRAEIRKYPNPRGALLSALHYAHAEHGRLTPEIFSELSPYFAMKPSDIAEVASFYPLFRPRGAANIQVCTGLPCCLRGARTLVRDLEMALGCRANTIRADGRFSLTEVECVGSCGSAPVIQVNDRPYLENVSRELIADLTRSPQAAVDASYPAPDLSRIPEGVDGYLLPPNGERWITLDRYKAKGGFRAIEKAATMAPREIAALVEASGLRGRGGAGFVTGKKWTFMPPPDQRPRYIAINADESEPGTFKDRQIMERNPFLMIEGIMIAGLAMQSTAAFIYVRAEYAEAYARVLRAIEEASEAGILGEHAIGFNRSFTIHIQRGAGAYICGEESGMLESMEGKKGMPRKRPPFPAQSGLWSQPTTVNNVETLSNVPAIIFNGADWFKQRGAPNSTGHMLIGVSGQVRNPGIYELPLGTRLSDIINKYAGGVAEGRKIKAVIPGGVSMPVLDATQLEVGLDHESIKSVGSQLGTAAVIVMDDSACMVRAAMVIARFFDHESCGQCTQCREGTGWLHRTLERIESGHGTTRDMENLLSCCGFMEGQTICALSDAAAWAARGFATRFRAEFDLHIASGRCPMTSSFEA